MSPTLHRNGRKVYRTPLEIRDVRRDLHECLTLCSKLSGATRRWNRRRGLRREPRHFTP